MEIITKRFLLREFIEEDESAFIAYHADPRYAEFCTPEEVTPDYARELLRLFGQWAVKQPRSNYQLAIAHRQNPQEIFGCCGLRREGYGPDTAELGIELAPQCWGRYGYAIEVASALVEFGFRDLGLKKISGISVSANSRVERLARRYGFVAVEIHPDARGWSQTEWQLTREIWQQQRDYNFGRMK
jgi:RimJ/RimL family protein N-acetyltransferase